MNAPAQNVTRRLFVGGPWHGRVVAVPSDHRHYRVPIFESQQSFASLRTTDPPTALYELRTFASGGTYTGVRVFSLHGLTDPGSYVFDAAARALDLSIIEGPNAHD